MGDCLVGVGLGLGGGLLTGGAKALLRSAKPAIKGFAYEFYSGSVQLDFVQAMMGLF